MSIEQEIQDQITMSYAKWSEHRRRANLPADHSLWQKEKDKVISRQRRDNQAARQKTLTALKRLAKPNKPKPTRWRKRNLPTKNGGLKINGLPIIRAKPRLTLKTRRGI